MKQYKKPGIKSLAPKDFREYIGSAQTQYLTFDIYRGSHLSQPKDYKYCELNSINPSTKIYKISQEEVIENA